jgi:hypothetical protein
MIVSGNMPTQTSALARGLILACAAFLLPLGVAYSQQARQDEPQVNAPSQELRKLVESGEMTVEDARVLFNALNPADWVGNRYAVGVEEIDAAVEAGRASVEAGIERKDALAATLQGVAFYMEVFGLSSDEARRKVAADGGSSLRKAKVASRSGDAASLDWMYERMTNAGIPREKLAEVMGAVKKVMPRMESKGADFQLDPRMHAHLTSLGLTNEQIQLVLGLSARAAKRLKAADTPERSEADGIKGYYARMGFGDADYEGMLANLGEQGFDPQLNDQLMGALLRLGMGMKESGPAYVTDPRMSQYLASLNVSQEQVRWLEGFARRLSKKMLKASDASQEQAETRGGADVLQGYFTRLNIDAERYAVLSKKLAALGLRKEQILGVLRGLIRVIPAMRSEGDAFQLDEKMAEYFNSLGLSSVQVEKTVEIARSQS